MSDRVEHSGPMQDVDEQSAAWPPWVSWALAAAAAVLVGLTPLVHQEGDGGVLLVLLPLAALVPWVLPLMSVRVSPEAFGVAVWIPLAALNWGGAAIGLDPAHDGQLSMMLLTLAVGVVASRARALTGIAYLAAALLIPLGRGILVSAFDPWVFWASGILLAGAAGAGLRRQQVLVTQLRRAQSALAVEAASRERQRIAREIHDVIAHSLTVTMLHVTAARMAIKRDPGEAEAALTEAERLGRQALADVRQTVGLLRADDASPTREALPGAEDLEALIGEYAAAGVPVTARCTVDMSTLTPAQGLAVYRTVQEALANAVKHAPGAETTVEIELGAEELLVRVTDTGPGLDGGSAPAQPGEGMGLLGMRERIEAVGGTVTGGPAGPGWEVLGRVPLGIRT